jgi:hypothetical protein
MLSLHVRTPASLLVGILLLTTCTGDQNPAVGIIAMDTLANGTVHLVSAPEGTWAHSGNEPWRLVEDLRIGVVEGEEPYMFGSARNVFPDPQGRIWVLDAHAFELRLFDQEGNFIRAVGREGGGPGEFGFNPCAFPGPNGEVWVEAGSRWQRFDSAGVFLGSQQVTRRIGCGVRGWLPDGRFVAVEVQFDQATRSQTTHFLVHDRELSGEVVVTDTVAAPAVPEPRTVRWLNPAGRVVITELVPLSHRPMWILGPSGDFWITDGDGDYRIRRQTLFGNTLVIMERPHEPVSVPDSIRVREIAELDREDLRLERSFDRSDVPDVFPPFDRLLIGIDGTLWVRRRLEGGRYGLDVFAPNGQFLGPVETPSDFGRMTIHRVTPEYMYGTVRDELDVEYAVRLAIQKPGE